MIHPSPLQNEVDLPEIVRVAWSSRFFLLLIVVISGIGVGLWTIKIPERYHVDISIKMERPPHADFTKEEMYAIFESDEVLRPVVEKYRINLKDLRRDLQIDRKKKLVLEKNGSFTLSPYFLVSFDSDRKDSEELLSQVVSHFKKFFQRHVQVRLVEITPEIQKTTADWMPILETITQVKKVKFWKIMTFSVLTAFLLGLMSVFALHFFRGSLQEKT